MMMARKRNSHAGAHCRQAERQCAGLVASQGEPASRGARSASRWLPRAFNTDCTSQPIRHIAVVGLPDGRNSAGVRRTEAAYGAGKPDRPGSDTVARSLCARTRRAYQPQQADSIRSRTGRRIGKRGSNHSWFGSRVGDQPATGSTVCSSGRVRQRCALLFGRSGFVVHRPRRIGCAGNHGGTIAFGDCQAFRRLINARCVFLFQDGERGSIGRRGPGGPGRWQYASAGEGSLQSVGEGCLRSLGGFGGFARKHAGGRAIGGGHDGKWQRDGRACFECRPRGSVGAALSRLGDSRRSGSDFCRGIYGIAPVSRDCAGLDLNTLA